MPHFAYKLKSGALLNLLYSALSYTQLFQARTIAQLTEILTVTRVGGKRCSVQTYAFANDIKCSL